MHIRVYYYRNGRHTLWEAAYTMEFAMTDFEYLHHNGWCPYMEKVR
jgi:hypothetical protein